MKGLIRWVWVGVVVGVLAVWAHAQLQGGGGSPLSPEILGVELWPAIPADGSKTFGAVRFRDADGDIVQARFDVVEAVDFAPFSFNPKVKGQTSESFPFFVFSRVPQKVRLRLTLLDEAGNQSLPVEFGFEAITLIECVGKWGTRGTGEAQFNGVSHIALDDRKRVYVTDFGLDRVQKFTNDGQLLAQWGGRGTGNGQLTGPLGIAVDYQGNVYVADAGNQRIQKFTESGAFITKWGSLGTGEGQFSFPTGVATDPAGNVYVADKVNNRIQPDRRIDRSLGGFWAGRVAV
jgi:DNA-binding beta-propeller fold protein YncE